MRLTVDWDGRATAVEVADDLATVHVGDRTYPVRVVARTATRVELEIGGVAVVVDGWPDHQPTPPGPLDINGERGTAVVRGDAGRPQSALNRPVDGRRRVDREDRSTAPDVTPGAIAIVPPMPGRVVEVRVRDGDAVAPGTVLLVVEAMKMRNEVTSPLAGTVRDVRVREGSNVRAREPMMFVAPEATPGPSG